MFKCIYRVKTLSRIILITLIIFCLMCMGSVIAVHDETKIPNQQAREDVSDEIGPILFISSPKLRSQQATRFRLYSMNEDGRNVKPVPFDTNTNVFRARWSPDGMKIVATTKDGLVIMNHDGSGKYLIARKGLVGGDYFHAGKGGIWSPDSKMLIYRRAYGNEVLGSYTFLSSVDGTDERMLPHKDDFPTGVDAWANDGKTLVGSVNLFTKDSSGYSKRYYKIAFLNLQGNILRTLGEVGENNEMSVLSPDGKRLVFSSTMGNWGWQVHIMDYDGSNEYELRRPDKYTFKQAIDWSPDGKKLLMNDGSESRSSRIFIVDLDTKVFVDVTPFNTDSTYSYAVSWRR